MGDKESRSRCHSQCAILSPIAPILPKLIAFPDLSVDAFLGEEVNKRDASIIPWLDRTSRRSLEVALGLTTRISPKAIGNHYQKKYAPL